MREEQFSAAIGDWSADPPHPRFGIYRNNVASALINALRVRYPVAAQLVGKDFFAAMAGAYADKERPSSAVLIDYGNSFPVFIRAFAPAASLLYLGDVAALESLWWHAYHAADSSPLPPGEFAAVVPTAWEGMRFAFLPSLGLLSSRHAVGSIWQGHHGGPALGSVDLTAPECVLVARPEMTVELRIIDPASHDLIAALSGGARLGDAVATVSARHAGFDLPAQLQGLISLNIITGLHP